MELVVETGMSIAEVSCGMHVATQAAYIADERRIDSYFPDRYIDDDLDNSDYNQEYRLSVDTRSTPYRRLLYVLACRVLGGSDGAEQAVQNCLAEASRDPSITNDEGAFRSWLLRLLIKEAVLLRYEKACDAALVASYHSTEDFEAWHNGNQQMEEVKLAS